MPEISDSEYRTLVAYQQLGAPDEIRRKNADLEKDNQKQRDEIRALTDKAAKVPPDDAVVLTGNDAKRWGALKDIPADVNVTEALKERDTLKAEAAERTRRDTLRAAGKAAFGTDAAGDVLDSVKGSEGWQIEMREEGDGDAKKRVPYVVPAEGQQAVKLSEFAEQKFAHLLPALKAEAAGGGQQGQKQEGRTFVRQSAEGAPAGGKENVAEAAIQRNRERASAPNALRPAKTTA